MGTRSTSRRLVMQSLFQIEASNTLPETALDSAMADEKFSKDAKQQALVLLNKILDNKESIDAQISNFSKDWPLERMSLVDKNILRIAFYEILFESETPDNVAASEAVKLAERYSSVEGVKFINGILGTLIKTKDIPH